MNPESRNTVLLEKMLDRVEAFALYHFLDSRGLPVALREPPLRTALGEIPFLEISMELVLEDPARMDEARGLIQQYRNGPAPVRGAIWTCDNCGETHQPEFGQCWKCGDPQP